MENLKYLNELLNSWDKTIPYQLLSRLKTDCDFFLSYGNRSSKYLWTETPEEHIEYMKAIWTSLPEDAKPEWLTWEDILNYEKRMINVENLEA